MLNKHLYSALIFLVNHQVWATHKEVRNHGYSWLDMAQLQKRGYAMMKQGNDDWEYTYTNEGKAFLG